MPLLFLDLLHSIGANELELNQRNNQQTKKMKKAWIRH